MLDFSLTIDGKVYVLIDHTLKHEILIILTRIAQSLLE